ncbi:MAG: MBL fold metallo-hydrolase [Sedimentisphaerales bacterium]|nr:MBL fold metallo-hydrolase [Sedimentisphaerales bacterium]
MSGKIKITILVDNTSNHPTLLAEHGWAVWIEDENHKILFDTGCSGVIQANAKVLGIDLSKADAIVLSHGHNDHSGGLMQLLDKNNQAKIYLHPDSLKPRYSCHSDKSVRNIGMPALTHLHLSQPQFHERIKWTTQPTEVLPGYLVTGPIRRLAEFEDVGGPFFQDAFQTEPDLILDDQALYFNSAQGLVVILGCAHAGVVNTLHYIADLTGQMDFFTVLGGMHLLVASPERIENTIKAFRVHNVQQIGTAHCTGAKATAKLWEALPDKCFACSVGTQIEFEPATQ